MLVDSSVVLTKAKNNVAKFLKRIESNEWPLYDFSKAIYIKNQINMVVVCKEHGEFNITPHHLKEKGGCPKCANCYRRTSTEYKQEVLEWTNGEIEALGEYINVRTKVAHKHVTCGHIWETLPSHIKSGTGCPKCASYGFNKTLPGTLYYISIDNGTAYKIGITNRKVQDRFSREELKEIEIIKTWDFVVGQEAYDKEQAILKEYKWAQYLGDNLLNNGNTEMFYTDVLHLDSRQRVTIK